MHEYLVLHTSSKLWCQSKGQRLNVETICSCCMKRRACAYHRMLRHPVTCIDLFTLYFPAGLNTNFYHQNSSSSCAPHTDADPWGAQLSTRDWLSIERRPSSILMVSAAASIRDSILSYAHHTPTPAAVAFQRSKIILNNPHALRKSLKTKNQKDKVVLTARHPTRYPSISTTKGPCPLERRVKARPVRPGRRRRHCLFSKCAVQHANTDCPETSRNAASIS